MTPRKAHDFHGFHPYDDRRVVKLKDQDPPYSVLEEQHKDALERSREMVDHIEFLYTAIELKKKTINKLNRILRFRDKTIIALQDKVTKLRKDNENLRLIVLWGWLSVYLLLGALAIHIIHYGF